MFVTADDSRRFAGDSRGKEFVIIWIYANLRMQGGRKSKMGFQSLPPPHGTAPALILNYLLKLKMTPFG